MKKRQSKKNQTPKRHKKKRTAINTQYLIRIFEKYWGLPFQDTVRDAIRTINETSYTRKEPKNPLLYEEEFLNIHDRDMTYFKLERTAQVFPDED